MTLDQFNPLYERFKIASSWIESEYKRLGWTYKKRTFNLKLEKDLRDFNENVLEPMEREWKQLSWQEKEAFKI